MLLDKLEECQASHALEDLLQSIGLVIDHEVCSHLCRLTRRDLLRGISNPSKYYDLMPICTLKREATGCIKIKRGLVGRSAQASLLYQAFVDRPCFEPMSSWVL
jgi:hypothetical protein